ncbi:MAG: PilC/PilY family type IV pilus protein [Desulfobacterales bacterium]|nr:PilC/PilY family type IV pilus protein [Desulfobacterales bacterium]
MKRSCKHMMILTLVALLAAAGGLSAGKAHAAFPTSSDAICASDNATPPFLSGGVDPNLLLLIDNSGSMLDLAYVVDGSNCYDDAFNSADTYAGYFTPKKLYVYDLTTLKFRTYYDGTDRSAMWTGAVGTIFYNGPSVDPPTASYSGNGVVWVKMNGTTSITAFVADGNFLNWAAASKIDIQKEILTGGKYDAANSRMIMESRGCGNKRFVKQVAVTNNADSSTDQLTLGVRPPKEQTFDNWAPATAYAVGKVVNDVGQLYIATVAGTSGAISTDDDNTLVSPPAPRWALYTKTRWTAGAVYVVGDIVSDPTKANTLDKGQIYIATQGGTAVASGGVDADNLGDASRPKWEPYNVAHIEIFKITDNGFSNTACEAAVDLLNEGGSQGQLKLNIDTCMGYSSAGGSTAISNANAAFNHAIHACWYQAKQGVWPPDAGTVTAQKNACENVYADINPWNITTESQAYGCYGIWTGDPATDSGYVGRCWKPGAPLVCTSYFTSGSKAGQCKTRSGGGGGGWDTSGAGYGSDQDACIEQALMDYCGSVQIPEVVDPSDQVPGTTTDIEGTFWNIPAVLVDSGVVAQLNDALYVMKGFIEQTTTPTGLVQEFSNDIRMGAMVFNQKGTTYECTQLDPNQLFECSFASNKDGGKVIADINKDIAPATAHTDSLVAAINGIKATSWTPIAESLYNALGYYGQNSAYRLDASDFTISSAVDPVQYHCQKNNILVITEGASTADINDSVTALGTGIGKDPDTSDVADCGSLKGSTLLDDLTYFAKESLGCYATPTMVDGEGNSQNKQTIATHIVVAGTLRDTGTADECNPKELLTRAAINGGTEIYQANNPTELENKLRAAFAAIRAGAAAGSAASVISASRSGEGAAYQAIFWPSVDLASGDKVQWIGEVHSLLVDSFGQLYEDSNGDHALDSGDQRIVFFFDQSINQTKACVGDLNASGACTGTTLNLEDVKYHWSAAQWLSEIQPTTKSTTAAGEILDNRTLVGATAGYISNMKKRFIFTWNDLNGDGVVGSNELLDFTPGLSGASVSGGRGPVRLDFGVQTDAEVDKIIRWVRGLDYTPDNLRLRQMPYDFDHDGTPEEVTWRLGDVIHSTPISVAAPAEGYHFLYRDSSYAQFVNAYKKRRHMIYFGGNDGMMHAVNGGFYDEALKKFCRTSNCSVDTNAPELGAEMWAYVPYNLLPHLKCMTSTGYQHKYYVDQRPRIFDVKLWDDTTPTGDGVHIGGWGTIMVGAMRFGGGKVRPGLLDLDGNAVADYGADTREFTSAYFVMDITDPEKPPKLLAEMTRTTSGSEAELGYTLAIPTLVVMKHTQADLSVTNKWYLIMGSGPTNVSGASTQPASVAVLPLDWLGQYSSTARAFRIPSGLPTVASNEGGQFVLGYTSNSFVSDPITVDFELEADYKSDVVYFGTVSGSAAPYGGGMQRLVTRQINSVTGKENETLPSQWATLLSTTPFVDINHPSLNNPLPLINTGQPVTASASVGTDGKNYWIYFGTGRFLDTADKSDASTQTYYGVKEPLYFSGTTGNCQSSFTWQTVEKTATNGWNTTPGEQGLLDVTKIVVKEGASAITAQLDCSDASACKTIESPVGTTNTLTTFNTMVDYIVGTGTGCNRPTPDSYGRDGWYKDLTLTKERNLGQATLLGGLVTYTSYQPHADPCLPEGLGYLYGVYFQTGTPFYIPIFISDFSTGIDTVTEGVIDRVALGRGLATTPNLHVGKQEGAKAFVQTSTGTIVEIPQPNLPIQNAKTGKAAWGELK